MDEPQKVNVGGIRSPDYLRSVYANFATVNSTPWDFRITFALLRTPLPGEEMKDAEQRGYVEPDAVADIIIPANLMVGFMTALKQNWDRYIQQFGVPGMDPSGPELPG